MLSRNWENFDATLFSYCSVIIKREKKCYFHSIVVVSFTFILKPSDRMLAVRTHSARRLARMRWIVNSLLQRTLAELRTPKEAGKFPPRASILGACSRVSAPFNSLLSFILVCFLRETAAARSLVEVPC